jgi:hypothetical protein
MFRSLERARVRIPFQSIAMPLARRVLLVALVGSAMWIGVRILDEAGRSGWAGAVIRRNLEAGVDARALFYTELDRTSRGEE